MSELPRKPRLWAPDQVQWVMDEINTGKPYKDIADAFNMKHAGLCTMKANHVKYIMAQYKKRLGVTAPQAQNHSNVLGNNAGPSQATQAQNARQPNTGGSAAPAGTDLTAAFPGAIRSGHAISTNTRKGRAHDDLLESPAKRTALNYGPVLHRPVCPERPNQEPTPLTMDPPLFDIDTVGVWQDGCHETCRINGQHTHSSRGEVTFPSTAAILEMMEKTRIFVPPPSKAVFRQLLIEMNGVQESTIDAINNPQRSSYGYQSGPWSDYLNGLTEQSEAREQHPQGPSNPATTPIASVGGTLLQSAAKSSDVPFQGQSSIYATNTWIPGPHNDCPIAAEHRHDIDSRICLRSVSEVAKMIGRMNGTFSLADQAKAMQSLRP